MTQAEQTEVVKIRLGSEDKVRLQEIAEKEFRSFADQCRLSLHEWLETKSARPGRGAAANTKETASTANNSRVTQGAKAHIAEAATS